MAAYHNIIELTLPSPLNWLISALRRPIPGQNRASKLISRVLDELETRIRYQNVGNNALSNPRSCHDTLDLVITSQLVDLTHRNTP